MCEAAAEGECLDVRAWATRACCVVVVVVKVAVCTEGVVVVVSCACDFPDSGGHAGSLANQSSSSGPVAEALLLSAWSFAVGGPAM